MLNNGNEDRDCYGDGDDNDHKSDDEKLNFYNSRFRELFSKSYR